MPDREDAKGETSGRAPLPSDEVKRLIERYEAESSRGGELRREVNLLRTLLEAVRGLNEIVEFGPLLSYVLRKAVEVADAERGFIMLDRTPEGGEALIGADAEGGEWEPREGEYSATVVDEVKRTGRRLIFDEGEAALTERKSVFRLGLNAVACFPLAADGETLGVLYLHSRKGRSFDTASLRTLGALSGIATAAINRAFLFAEREEARRKAERLNEELAKRLAERERALEVTKEALARQSEVFRSAGGYCGMVGVSPAFNKVKALLETLEGTELPVLIVGESGTGKELAARALHERSPRADGPFLAVNCGALPETTLASELFGHRKGAFTGAAAHRKGLFEMADGGTLFLDEVPSMSLNMQKALLRAVESGEILPVGAESPVKVDVRVVAATNRKVDELLAEGEFREDLYYRLAVVTVELPPLRERLEDVPFLIRHFEEVYGNPNGVEFTPEAVRFLQSLPWPGNIRQLENEIRRALALGRGKIGPEFFSHLAAGPRQALPPAPSLRMDELERWAIEKALEAAGGNRKQAAEILGIPRRTLYEKLKRLGL